MSLNVSKVRLFLLCAAALVLAFSAPVCAAVDFDALKKEAPDTVAWIKLDQTTLNYPVVQWTDNDYFLKRLPNGETSENGSIFMDSRSAPDFTAANTLIHGHRMRSGAMFGTLRNYTLQEYYDKHPTMWIYTPQGDYELLLFGCYSFDQQEETFPISFQDADAFNAFVGTVRERSYFQSGVEVNPGDFLVTLLTCEYENDDRRLMVIGKLLK